MIEQGLVTLIQGDGGVTATGALGGFLAVLPKGVELPAWTFQFLGGPPVNALGLSAGPGLVKRRLQIDCLAGTSAEVVQLAVAIDVVLDNYTGVLADADATRVDSCLRAEEPMDFWDAVSRSYRRMLEYDIWFYGQ